MLHANKNEKDPLYRYPIANERYVHEEDTKSSWFSLPKFSLPKFSLPKFSFSFKSNNHKMNDRSTTNDYRVNGKQHNKLKRELKQAQSILENAKTTVDSHKVMGFRQNKGWTLFGWLSNNKHLYLKEKVKIATDRVTNLEKKLQVFEPLLLHNDFKEPPKIYSKDIDNGDLPQVIRQQQSTKEGFALKFFRPSGDDMMDSTNPTNINNQYKTEQIAPQ